MPLIFDVEFSPQTLQSPNALISQFFLLVLISHHNISWQRKMDQMEDCEALILGVAQMAEQHERVLKSIDEAHDMLGKNEVRH